MSRAYPQLAAVPVVLRALDEGQEPARELLRDAVRGLLSQLSAQAPGHSVEVRIPPFGAIQCVAGPRHTRGTPPNVIEMDPLTWVEVATGRLLWATARAQGRLRASGVRADISPLLPLWAEGEPD